MFWELGISSFCFGNQDWVTLLLLFILYCPVGPSLYKGFWYLLDVLTCNAALRRCGVGDAKMRISGGVSWNLSFRKLCNEVYNRCAAEDTVLGNFV